MLLELAKIFLRLGVVSFGGPLAHIALMRSEFVEKRGWLTEQEFLDLNSAVNLIPGPNSTELAMHIGHRRAGTAGLWIAGACFILPAFFLVLLLSVLYTHFNSLTLSRALLCGVSPVVVAIIGQALLKFAPAALKTRPTQLLALACLLTLAAGAGEVAVILAVALSSAVFLWGGKLLKRPKTQKPFPILILLSASPLAPLGASASIFWSFLKIGSIIYGSGYVLLAYMRAEFVEKLGWLTDRQLLDAVAIGQMTPGPLFTSATFVGFQVGGWAGALAATLGIFLPSFFFVMCVAGFLGRMNGSPQTRLFLDFVNAASFALMVAVTVELASSALLASGQLDLRATAIFLTSALLLWKTKLNSALWLLMGAVSGLVLGPQ